MKTELSSSCGRGEDERALQYKIGFLGIPDSTKGEMRVPVPWNAENLGRFRRRALAYAYHLRETNLATVMRVARKAGQELPGRATAELLVAMQADLDNYRADQPSPAPTLLDEVEKGRGGVP